MLKVVYVRVPVTAKVKRDTPLFVIEHQALSNFLKVNRLDMIYAISDVINYDPAERKYCIAIRFHI